MTISYSSWLIHKSNVPWTKHGMPQSRYTGLFRLRLLGKRLLLSLWTLSSRSPTIPSLYKLNNQQTYHQRTHEFATLFKSALFMLQTQFTSPDSRSQFWWDVKQITQMRVNYSLGLPMPLQENSGTEGWLSLNLQPPILSTQPWWPQSK